MKAARIHHFGSPDVIQLDDVPRPSPGPDQVLIRVAAAGVGPWDALIREKKSVIDVPLPLTLGSDLAGIVESVGSEVSRFRSGEAVYGATNAQFTGACAEYALASASMIARKPDSLTFEQAASVPVVAVTAWQMLYDYAQAQPGQSVLVHAAAGSVGAYAVQLAKLAGLRVFATASSDNIPFVKSLGADAVIDYKAARFEDVVPQVDIVLDMVGGDTKSRSFPIVKPGGILVSVVSADSRVPNEAHSVRSVFFLVEVTTQRLDSLTALFDRGELKTQVGTVLPLDRVRDAHAMLGGVAHRSGKIVLSVADLP